MLKGAWSVVTAWFGGLNLRAIGLGLSIAATVAYTVVVYQVGRRSGLADEQKHILQNNVKQALKYQADVDAANDAADRERQRATALAEQNVILTEQVKNVAKGNASPGVDAAIHGVRPRTAPARKP